MCIFCEIVKGNIPSYKVYEDDDVLAFLDISQVTKGHTLVIPKKHYDNFLEIDPEELKNLIVEVQKVAKIVQEKTQCLGINVLTNINEVAGQSVKHLHFHIIPRYSDKDAVDIKFNESNIKVEETYKMF